MADGRLKCNDCRPRLTVEVTARPSETIGVNELSIEFAQNREPCVEVPAENLVLSPCVGLQFPNSIRRDKRFDTVMF
jgi:hypothetical protein